jgi:hypothetical protein
MDDGQAKDGKVQARHWHDVLRRKSTWIALYTVGALACVAAVVCLALWLSQRVSGASRFAWATTYDAYMAADVNTGEQVNVARGCPPTWNVGLTSEEGDCRVILGRVEGRLPELVDESLVQRVCRSLPDCAGYVVSQNIPVRACSATSTGFQRQPLNGAEVATLYTSNALKESRLTTVTEAVAGPERAVQSRWMWYRGGWVL